jgi:hypothetical protein
MNFREYRVIEPDLDSPLGQELGSVADEWPNRLARMCNAIDAFMSNIHVPGYRVAPAKPELRYEPDLKIAVEIYLVPRIYEDASALLRVDHIAKRVSYIAVYGDYGGYDEAAQWQEILELALKAAD